MFGYGIYQGTLVLDDSVIEECRRICADIVKGLELHICFQDLYLYISRVGLHVSARCSLTFPGR
jgi:hypothetical protein